MQLHRITLEIKKMWILNLFTGYIISLLSFIFVATGLIGYVGTTFVFDTISWLLPQIKPYSKVISALSVILLIVGCFLRGTIYSNDKWEIKVKTAQAKVAELEAKGQTITEVIKVVKDTKIKYITLNGNSYLNTIDSHALQIDTIGVLPDSIVYWYNSPLLQRGSK